MQSRVLGASMEINKRRTSDSIPCIPPSTNNYIDFLCMCNVLTYTRVAIRTYMHMIFNYMCVYVGVEMACTIRVCGVCEANVFDRSSMNKHKKNDLPFGTVVDKPKWQTMGEIWYFIKVSKSWKTRCKYSGAWSISKNAKCTNTQQLAWRQHA